MSSSHALDEFWSFPKFGEGIGFHRLFRLLEKLDSLLWLEQFPTIKVTGSNGKGSTCAFIAQILQAGGSKVGLFISPHLFRFHERISLNGESIPEEALQTLLSQVLSIAKTFKNERFGRFELVVALAILYFQQQNAELGVIEVGIGGRFDSTRIFRGPVTVLTSLDLEHTDLLGTTKEMIGYEKLDLADPSTDVVLGNIPLELIQKLNAFGKLNHLRLHPAMEVLKGKIDSETMTHLTLSIQHPDFYLSKVTLPLGGHFQSLNLQTALLASFLYLRKKNLWLGSEHFSSMVIRGLSQLRWEGRFQKVSDDPELFVDAGHTGEAMRALRETVQTVLAPQPILLLLGISFNKNKSAILDEILPVAQEIICTQAIHHGEKIEILEPMIRARSQVPLCCLPDLREALHWAKEKARTQGMILLVAGSLFLSIEVVTLLRGEDPRDLRFL